jgi:hypothetical protein
VSIDARADDVRLRPTTVAPAPSTSRVTTHASNRPASAPVAGRLAGPTAVAGSVTSVVEVEAEAVGDDSPRVEFPRVEFPTVVVVVDAGADVVVVVLAVTGGRTSESVPYGVPTIPPTAWAEARASEPG